MKITSFNFYSYTDEDIHVNHAVIEFCGDGWNSNISIDFDVFYQWARTNSELKTHTERNEDNEIELDTYVIKSIMGSDPNLQEEFLKDVLNIK